MLKGVNPLLHADLLATLCAMGHGDDLVIADANFPSESVARHTTLGKVLRLDGADVPQAVRAILSVFPLDTFVDTPALRMQVVGNATELPAIQHEVQADHLHAQGRCVDKGIQGKYGQDRAHRLRNVRAVQPKYFP